MTEALGVDVSAGGVRSMWLRNNMNTTALRVERSQALQEEERLAKVTTTKSLGN
jgi:hypothetical protein